MLFADHLIHAWDLARAIGADERLDAGLVASCGELVRRGGGGYPTLLPTAHAGRRGVAAQPTCWWPLGWPIPCSCPAGCPWPDGWPPGVRWS
jgi:hypothetical protein